MWRFLLLDCTAWQSMLSLHWPPYYASSLSNGELLYMISNRVSSGKYFVYYFSSTGTFVALGSSTNDRSHNLLTVCYWDWKYMCSFLQWQSYWKIWFKYAENWKGAVVCFVSIQKYLYGRLQKRIQQGQNVQRISQCVISSLKQRFCNYVSRHAQSC